MRRLLFVALERMNIAELRGGRELAVRAEALLGVLDQIEWAQLLIFSVVHLQQLIGGAALGWRAAQVANQAA